MSKEGKSEAEILQPEVERQLPVKPVVIPSIEELNRLIEHMLAQERRRVRRALAGGIAIISLIFTLILAVSLWFTNGVLRQLQAERQLSEKSRLDLLSLAYAGQKPETAVSEPDALHTMPAPAADAAAPDTHATGASATLMEHQAPGTVSTPETPRPAATIGAFSKSIEVQAAGGLTLRLPIPPVP